MKWKGIFGRVEKSLSKVYLKMFIYSGLLGAVCVITAWLISTGTILGGFALAASIAYILLIGAYIFVIMALSSLLLALFFWIIEKSIGDNFES